MTTKVVQSNRQSQSYLINIKKIKLTNAFFYHYTLNLLRIYGTIVDTMTIFLIQSQRFQFANMVLKILLEK